MSSATGLLNDRDYGTQSYSILRKAKIIYADFWKESVNKLLHKTQNKQQTKTENNKFITLTYINNETQKVADKFKKAGYRIAYKTTNKTEHTLSKHTHKAQNKFDQPGVYKLNCSDCNKFYIGQTGLSAKQRYIEHTKAPVSYTHLDVYKRQL